jgi:acetylglutamate kinase
MKSLIVVKIGGHVIDNPGQLQPFLQAFAGLEGAKILVHGGGSIATRMGHRLGIESKYVGGRRITDEASLELITMVYGGLVNKQLVAVLQQAGCNAIGLSGADGKMILAERRVVKDVDYGFVGDVQAGGVNQRFLQTLLEAGLQPVLAPLSYSDSVGLLNTNADTIAQEVAKAMSSYYATQLIYCFEKAGVLRDQLEEGSVIPQIDEVSFLQLQQEGVVADGMIPKLSNALAARAAGVQSIVIGKAADLPELVSLVKEHKYYD